MDFGSSLVAAATTRERTSRTTRSATSVETPIHPRTWTLSKYVGHSNDGSSEYRSCLARMKSAAPASAPGAKTMTTGRTRGHRSPATTVSAASAPTTGPPKNQRTSPVTMAVIAIVTVRGVAPPYSRRVVSSGASSSSVDSARERRRAHSTASNARQPTSASAESPIAIQITFCGVQLSVISIGPLPVGVTYQPFA